MAAVVQRRRGPALGCALTAVWLGGCAAIPAAAGWRWGVAWWAGAPLLGFAAFYVVQHARGRW